MRVVFGLGNPGRKYERTRHNIGFLVVDALACKYKIEIDSYGFQSLMGRINISGKEVLLVKPLTYMNLAGVAAKDISQNFNVRVEDILVVSDDADLEVGRIKFSRNGGDAGHLGVRSVIENLRSKDFPRLRIGIGRPPEGMALRDYVLQDFLRDEWELMQEVLLRAVTAIEVFIDEGIERAMLLFNLR